jgi:hypothetical protein
MAAASDCLVAWLWTPRTGFGERYRKPITGGARCLTSTKINLA